MTDDTTSPDQWDVFISYSSTDKAMVTELARRLSSYRQPSPWWTLPWPKRLRVFLDDQQKAGVRLWPELEAAIKRSSTLVVACSPAARCSEAVKREIETFCDANRDSHIVPILVGGLANATAIKEGREDLAAIPDPVLAIMGDEPWLPRFLSPHPFGRRNRDSWYHLLAAIYRTTRDAIEDRERRRLRRKQIAVVGALLFAFGALGMLKFIEDQRLDRNLASAVTRATASDAKILVSALKLDNASTPSARKRARLDLMQSLGAYPMQMSMDLGYRRTPCGVGHGRQDRRELLHEQLCH